MADIADSMPLMWRHVTQARFANITDLTVDFEFSTTRDQQPQFVLLMIVRVDRIAWSELRD
ncbi:hypothetical protein BKD09_40690 [Bradyrhizobium japonicum]|uniref:Uncharacterized protein n=1 Tax=Bradyrhizobium japonicum TaxID=375 RepID=A0A1L3FMZ9_BRAJP|nr:hypothetical protein BKD09_40690 [Bradyrhizobium japonicum]KMJ94815.1 hypothetical protein CF64_35755 [Bradyrhizobium japonicum]